MKANFKLFLIKLLVNYDEFMFTKWGNRIIISLVIFNIVCSIFKWTTLDLLSIIVGILIIGIGMYSEEIIDFLEEDIIKDIKNNKQIK